MFLKNLSYWVVRVLLGIGSHKSSDLGIFEMITSLGDLEKSQKDMFTIGNFVYIGRFRKSIKR